MVAFNTGAGAATLQLNIDVGAVSGNSSRVDWSLYLYCYNGRSFNLSANVGWSVNIAGNGYSGAFAYDFRGTSAVLIASGSTWVGHDGNGNATISVSGFKGVDGSSDIADNVTVSASVNLPRIPKPPVTNGAPAVSNLAPTSVKLTWPANTNNNGAAIDQYLLRINKKTPVDGPGYVDYPLGASTLSHTVTGLTPGTQYYAAVYAHNGQGYSPKSADTSFKTLSGAYVRRGSTWKPVEVMVYRSGQWKSAEVLVYRNGAWVPAT